MYHEKVKTSRVFIRDCSMVCVYPMVLFGGGHVSVELQRGQFIISLDDGWVKFAAASREVKETCTRILYHATAGFDFRLCLCRWLNW